MRLGRARYLIEENVPARRLVVTVGQLAVTDLLDQNAYANNSRMQFLNLAFVNELAYDLPQDAHGYSRGVFVDYVTPSFAGRAASFQLRFQLPAAPGVSSRGTLPVRFSPASSCPTKRKLRVRRQEARSLDAFGLFPRAIDLSGRDSLQRQAIANALVHDAAQFCVKATRV